MICSSSVVNPTVVNNGTAAYIKYLMKRQII